VASAFEIPAVGWPILLRAVSLLRRQGGDKKQESESCRAHGESLVGHRDRNVLLLASRNQLRCYPLPAVRFTLSAEDDGTVLFEGDFLLFDNFARRPCSIFLTSIIWPRVALKSVSVIARRSRATMKWCSNSEAEAS